MWKAILTNEDAMLKLGSVLAHALEGHGALHITGELGAGKTTLCRGILRAMGHEGAVKSPTFTLVEPYRIDDTDVYHFDLYRLADPGELDYIGIDEYFDPANLCLIEWPEKAGGYLPQHDLEIGIDVSGEKRNIGIKPLTRHGETVCDRLEKEFRA
jgi:tRNA threonylcarbamoyladenosine biosynthesis protein TsaE